MKILFLNCANRKNDYVKKYAKDYNIDMIILAESKNIRNKISCEFNNSFVSKYNYGISVFSNINMNVKDVDYIINDVELQNIIHNDNYKNRILDIAINDYHILAVHIDYGFYNPFAMNKIDEYIRKNKIDMIVGDFNSGYLNDNLDYKKGGIIFQNGYLYFKKYEEMGYINAKKDCGLYSFASKRGNKKFRIDHCFSKNINLNVEYIEDFLNLNVSDHKGILIDFEIER